MKNKIRSILYVGDLRIGRTSYHRYKALVALGYTVLQINSGVGATVGISRYIAALRNRSGYPADSTGANGKILQITKESSIDLLWLDKPLFIKPKTLEMVRNFNNHTLIAAYSPDDMLNPANQSSYHSACLPLLDAYFTTKSFHVSELKHAGCKNVFFVPNSFDNSTHRPFQLTLQERRQFESRVGFIGGFEIDRFTSLLYLARNNVPVHIKGSFWNRAPQFHPNMHVDDGDLVDTCYSKAICATKINLCFLRKINRDLQTTRSVEIPACGGFMLAERTEEHCTLFEEGKEAEYFNTNAEMLEKIEYYLVHDEEREAIAAAGRARCIFGGYSNESRLQELLNILIGLNN